MPLQAPAALVLVPDCDIGKEAYDKFKEVLQPYRKQRPKSKEE